MTPIPEDPTGERAQPEGNHQQQQIATLERDIRAGEKWLIGLTGAMAFFALCGVVVSVLQWRTYSGQLGVMTQQLTEMKSGGVDTHALALAAISQSQAAETLGESAKAQAIAATEQLNSLMESVELTRQSNRLTRDALYATESADIEVDHVECHPELLGLTTDVTAIIKNVGRTTATELSTIVYMGILGAAMTPPVTPAYSSTLGANQSLTLIGLRVGNATTEDELRRINDRQLRLVLFGWATYRDRFGRKHLMVFASTYIPRSQCVFQIDGTAIH